jgi:hypothetical protein
MNWFRPFRLYGAVSAAGFFLFTAITQSLLGGDMTSAMILDDATNPAKNLARMNCGATIDLIGPDGRIVTVTNKDSSASALLFDDDTLGYQIPEGDTTLLLSFPRTSALDRVTFVNENASAAGEMRISVSNYRLPAKSPTWN